MKYIITLLLVVCQIVLVAQTLTFQETQLTGLPTNLTDVTSKWADMDGDGDQDVLIHGMNGSLGINGLYENVGGNNFELHTELPQWTKVDFAWQDYDLDGDVDFVMSGYLDGQSYLWLYEQDDLNTFSGASTGLPVLPVMKLQWGNMNNDAFPDLAYIGGDLDINYVIIYVYGSNGDGTFNKLLEDQDSYLNGYQKAFEMELLLSDYNSDNLTDLVFLTRSELQFIQQVSPGVFEYEEWGLNNINTECSPFNPGPCDPKQGPLTQFGPSGNVSFTMNREEFVFNAVKINYPLSIVGNYKFGTAVFGGSIDEITGEVVLVDDGSANSTEGCFSIQNAGELNGKIALIDRGSCAFTQKVKNAQEAGAIGAIIINNQGDDVVYMGGDDPTITIPAVSIGLSSGNLIKSELPGVEVSFGLSGIYFSGSGYQNQLELIEESIDIENGEYFLTLSDSYRNGFNSPGYFILKDDLGRTIFEMGSGETYLPYKFPFCIGEGADCYQSPIHVELQLDEFPEQTFWSIFSSIPVQVDLINNYTERQQSVNAFNEHAYAWGDVDQDGQSDALIRRVDGNWHWVLNKNETWEISNIITSDADFQKMYVTEIDEKLGLIYSRDNMGVMEWYSVKPVESQTLYTPPVPQNFSIAISSGEATLEWTSDDPFASYEIQIGIDGEWKSLPVGYEANPVGFWGINSSARFFPSVSGQYEFRMRSIGQNGRRSAYSSIVQGYILSTVNAFTQLQIPAKGTDDGHSKWADYDNDGDLDLLIDGNICGYCLEGTDQRFFQVLVNNDGVFEDAIMEAPDEIQYSNINSPSPSSWVDYDLDGDTDIIIGTKDEANNSITYFLKNVSGVFVNFPSTVPGIDQGSYNWLDFDNDGDNDLIVSGGSFGGSWFTTENTFTKLYENIDGEYYVTDQQFTIIQNESMVAFDFDNDGWTDIIRSGTSIEGEALTEMYWNDHGELISVSHPFENVHMGAIANADYDNDGDLDIILTGNRASTSAAEGDYLTPPFFDPIAVLYENQNGMFVATEAIVEGVYNSTVSWGDFDNDGDRDLLIGGATWNPSLEAEENFANDIIQVYANDNNDFSLFGYDFDGVANGTASWGDYDKDGDLDFISNGGATWYSGDSRYPIIQLYRNNSEISNSAPGQVTNIVVNGNNERFEETIISWDAAIDTETTGNGINYHVTLFLGDTQITPDINSVQPGSFLSVSKRVFKGLSPGDYLAKIYAIDAGLMVSDPSEIEFSVMGTFVERDDFTVQVTFAAVGKWVDFDNNGFLDAVTQSTELGLWQNVGGLFNNANASNEILGSNDYPNISWADYDNDGDQDMLSSGSVNNFSSSTPKLYNNDLGTFSLVNINLPDSYMCYHEWGDFDNDGDLDILFSTTDAVHIYRNDDQIFNSILQYSSTYNPDENIKWVDFDSDGDLDFVKSGVDGNRLEFYKNDGDAEFLLDASQPYFPYYIDEISFGDYDNDGDQDLVLVTGSPLNEIRLYRNQEGLFIKDQLIMKNMWASDGMVSGDYDNDGDLDWIMSGALLSDGVGKRATRILKNQNGVFTVIEETIDDFFYTPYGVGGTSADWGDYDNDSDLDLLISGLNGLDRLSKIYENKVPNINTKPTAPANLLAELKGDSIIFSWDLAVDAETPSAGLSYNIIFKNGTERIISPHALSDGKLTLTKIGNAGQTNSYYFDGSTIPDGVYSWSVQAIDHSYAGSEFSAEETFTMCYGFINAEVNLNLVGKLQIGQTVSLDFALPANTASYQLDFGDGYIVSENEPHFYTVPGWYTITLNIVSDLGCENVQQMEIEVEDIEPKPKITNVITPNGDNKNDYLIVSEARLDLENTLEIFNSVGQSLFKISNYQNDWGGLSKGQPLPAGQYLAVFENPSLGVKVRQVFNILRD